MRHHLALWLYCSTSLILHVKSLVKEAPMPDLLLQCYQERRIKEDISITPGFIIQSNCIDKYLWHTVESRYSNHSLSRNQINWIRSLDREFNAMRHHVPQYPMKTRREIRMLSESEREEFFQAVNELKNDKTIEPNMYDAFAKLHQGVSIRSAHFGTNFLGWHRVYLYYLELALRRKISSVTLPYWDSTLDSGMTDPIKSVIFSKLFVGGGDGSVEDGPFRNWITMEGTPISRNVGCPGEVVPKEREEFISQNVTILHHWQVTDGSIEPLRNTIEGIHNQVHTWVGDTMGQLQTSPQDPIFFLHHCYVDYLWELFRRKQIANGINPKEDYNGNGGFPHSPFAPMYGFPWLSNIDGFSNIFTSLAYRYENSPRCPVCGFSPYLRCSPSLQRCVSKSIDDFPHWSENNFISSQRSIDIHRQNQKNVHMGFPFDLGLNAHGTLGMRFEGQNGSPGVHHNVYRKKRYADFFPQYGLYGSKTTLPAATRQTSHINADLESIFRRDSNSYQLDGVQNINRWSFMPVKIVYNSCSKFDMYYKQPQARYLTCPKYDRTSLNKIFVRSDGFNYRGEHSNSLVIDQFSKDLVVYMIVAFKNPTLGYGVSYVTAYDIYGRACKPKCLVLGSYPPMYRPCSGVIHTSLSFPNIYEYSYDEAVRKVEYLNTKREQCDTFLMFQCDLDAEWFWG